MFGKRFTAAQIVNETLTRSLKYSGHMPSSGALAQAITGGIDTTAGETELHSHPVAVWLENRIALEEREGQLIRRKPLKTSDVVSALAEASAKPEPICKETLANLLLWISSVNESLMAKGSRYTILPFKLHQFIAQTGSVYTTLTRTNPTASSLLNRASTNRTTRIRNGSTPTSSAAPLANPSCASLSEMVASNPESSGQVRTTK